MSSPAQKNGPLFDKRKQARQHTATAIGNLFRSGRLARGVHQDVFAKILGISRRHMSAIELGDMLPPEALLFGLAKHAGIPLQESIDALNKHRHPHEQLVISGETIRLQGPDPADMIGPPDAQRMSGADRGSIGPAAGSLDWLAARGAAPDLAKVNEKLEQGYAERCDDASAALGSYSEFVRWVEQEVPMPLAHDDRTKWSMAVLDLFSLRRAR
jgi:transcriptional regulator with XRE-family HTH domain